MTLLARAGVCEYDGRSDICGQTDDGVLLVTGLRWLAGETSERLPVTVAHARAYLEGGIDGLRASLQAHQ